MEEENLNQRNDCMDDDVMTLFMQLLQADLESELFGLIFDYFTISEEVSKLCESLRKCRERAEHNECLLMDQALRDFEHEKKDYGGDTSFSQTVRGVKKYNECYGSFDYDFLLGDIGICHRKLTTMMVTQKKMTNEIDKKLKPGRRIAIVALNYICNHLGKSLLGESFVTSEPKTKALKRKKTLIEVMKSGTMVALIEVQRIRRLVLRLKTVDSSIRVTADVAVKKGSSVAVAMGWMEEDQKSLKSTLVDLDKATARCNNLMQFGRKVARDRIVEFLTRREKSFN